MNNKKQQTSRISPTTAATTMPYIQTSLQTTTSAAQPHTAHIRTQTQTRTRPRDLTPSFYYYRCHIFTRTHTSHSITCVRRHAADQSNCMCVCVCV